MTKPVYFSKLEIDNICNGYVYGNYNLSGFDVESDKKSCKALCTGYC